MTARHSESLAGPLTLVIAGLTACYAAGYALEQGLTSSVAVAAMTAMGIWSLLVALGASVRLIARIDQREHPKSRH